MITCRNYINGMWIPSNNGEEIESINPATGEAVCTIPNASLDEVQEAITNARMAFESTTWAEGLRNESTGPLSMGSENERQDR